MMLQDYTLKERKDQIPSNRKIFQILLVLILFQSSLSQLPYKTTSPVWQSSTRYFRSGSNHIITTMKDDDDSPLNFTITFQEPFPTDSPSIVYGLQQYIGGNMNTGVGQGFDIAKSSINLIDFSLIVTIQQNTPISSLKIHYLALDHVNFPHQMNFFENVPVQYSIPTTLGSVITHSLNYVNYTYQIEDYGNNRDTAGFQTPLQNNKIVFFLNSFYGKDDCGSGLKFQVEYEIVNQTHYKMEVMSFLGLRIFSMKFSQIIFNTQSVSSTGIYSVQLQEFALLLQNHTVTQTAFKQFKDSFLMGLKSFSTVYIVCLLRYQWQYLYDANGTADGLFINNITGSPCTLQQVKTQLFLIKEIKCYESSQFKYLNQTSLLCQNDCAFYYIKDETWLKCLSCHYSCKSCSEQNRQDRCLQCQYEMKRQLIKYSDDNDGKYCKCWQGYQDNVQSVQCFPVEFITKENTEIVTLILYLFGFRLIGMEMLFVLQNYQLILTSFPTDHFAISQNIHGWNNPSMISNQAFRRQSYVFGQFNVMIAVMLSMLVLGYVLRFVDTLIKRDYVNILIKSIGKTFCKQSKNDQQRQQFKRSQNLQQHSEKQKRRHQQQGKIVNNDCQTHAFPDRQYKHIQQSKFRNQSHKSIHSQNDAPFSNQNQSKLSKISEIIVKNLLLNMAINSLSMMCYACSNQLFIHGIESFNNVPLFVIIIVYFAILFRILKYGYQHTQQMGQNGNKFTKNGVSVYWILVLSQRVGYGMLLASKWRFSLYFIIATKLTVIIVFAKLKLFKKSLQKYRSIIFQIHHFVLILLFILEKELILVNESIRQSVPVYFIEILQSAVSLSIIGVTVGFLIKQLKEKCQKEFSYEISTKNKLGQNNNNEQKQIVQMNQYTQNQNTNTAEKNACQQNSCNTLIKTSPQTQKSLKSRRKIVKSLNKQKKQKGKSHVQINQSEVAGPQSNPNEYQFKYQSSSSKGIIKKREVIHDSYQREPQSVQPTNLYSGHAFTTNKMIKSKRELIQHQDQLNYDNCSIQFEYKLKAKKKKEEKQILGFQSHKVVNSQDATNNFKTKNKSRPKNKLQKTQKSIIVNTSLLYNDKPQPQREDSDIVSIKIENNE